MKLVLIACLDRYKRGIADRTRQQVLDSMRGTAKVSVRVVSPQDRSNVLGLRADLIISLPIREGDATDQRIEEYFDFLKQLRFVVNPGGALIDL